MSELQIAGATALVTGASRGFGRGIATALSRHGAQVAGVARDRGPLEELRAELGGSFTAVAADAADPNVAGRLVDTHHPRILVLNAGATPLPRPIQRHTWETFSRNWDVDVRHAFGWTREALLAPLAPGSIVITLSSGAALRGSPLSGGYVCLAAPAAHAGDRPGRGVRRRLRRPGPCAHPGAGRAGGHRAGHRRRPRPGRLPAHRRGAEPAMTARRAGRRLLPQPITLMAGLARGGGRGTGDARSYSAGDR